MGVGAVGGVETVETAGAVGGVETVGTAGAVETVGICILRLYMGNDSFRGLFIPNPAAKVTKHAGEKLQRRLNDSIFCRYNTVAAIFL